MTRGNNCNRKPVFWRAVIIRLICMDIWDDNIMIRIQTKKPRYIQGSCHAKWECWQWDSYQIRKVAVAHTPGMPGMFSMPPGLSDPNMHHDRCETNVPWCMPGSLTSSFFWGRLQGKRSRNSRPMRNPQFYVSGKIPMQIVREFFPIKWTLKCKCSPW